MPELREPVVGGGFWIRRVDYSRTDMKDQNKIQRFPTTDNKENSPRVWRRSPAERLRRPGRSPLPQWYPRTPLRDITSIVRAYERKRLRIQAAETSAAAASTSAIPRLQVANPQPQVSSTASQASLKPTKEAFPSMTATTMTTIVTTMESLLQAEEPPKTPTTMTGLINDGPPPETESMLLKSIEQIEKSVMRNMRTMKKPKSRRVTQLQNLRSMR